MTAKEARELSAAAATAKKTTAKEEERKQNEALESLRASIKKNLESYLRVIHANIRTTIESGNSERGEYYACGEESEGLILANLLCEALKADGYRVEPDSYTPCDVEGYPTGPTSYSLRIYWKEKAGA